MIISFKKLIIPAVLLFVGGNLFAQLAVSGGLTAQQLAEKLAGNNVVVTNATIIGDSVQHGEG